MKNRKSTLIAVLFIILVGIFGVKALLYPGYFTSHDGWHQVVRLHYFNESVKEGIIPPQFITSLYYGYGYPLFIFSYHLPWIIAEPFMFLGMDVFNSIKAVYFIGFILSGLSMFFFLSRRFGILESTVGSTLYLYAPYRFSNIFVRGAIGEATIFIFLPLLFYAIDSASKKFNLNNLIIGSISVAAIILSHAIVAVLVFISTAIYVITAVLLGKNKKYISLKIFSFFILGLLISSYYLVPSITMRQYTKFDELIKSTRFDGQSVTLKNLIYSKWGYGFATPRNSDSMYFQVGLAHWLVITLTIIYLIWYLVKKKEIGNINFLTGFLSIFLMSVILILPLSVQFWIIVSDQLFHIDFPWRLLTMVVFSASALTAYLLYSFPHRIKIILGLIILSVAFYTNRNHLRVNEYTNIPLQLYLDSEDTTNTYDEYLPKWVNKNEVEKIKKGSQISSNENIVLSSNKKTVNGFSFNYISKNDNQITLGQLFFPGWRLLIDGKMHELNQADLGLITFQAPAGKHSVLLSYEGTTLIKISRLVSLGAVIFIIVILIRKKRLNWKI